MALGSGGGAGRLTVNGLPISGGFAIGYVHSIYKAPSAEVFTVEGRRFTMRAVVSASENVLDYYALEGTRSRTEAGAWLLLLATPATYDELSLLTTSIGRRTLVAGGRCLPLYPDSGAAEVRVAVELTLDGRGEPCRPPYDGAAFSGPSQAAESAPTMGPRSAVHRRQRSLRLRWGRVQRSIAGCGVCAYSQSFFLNTE
ncbi:DUF1850 domain-containing protein [Nonomuraea basaltis]|uniref:DUF1850 domain-containing protein n=1 Tax=Nonomuraea basaltis TaxID=2495887 RepID=UPI00110C400F|nr:DUF1850 domain-containing protein [Nonomuraea basaltis]TMR93503.1 DUF1850 domain-containing protein [Nonomuraea basaltis]